MKKTPMILGACAAAMIAGAVSGAAINTDPIASSVDTLDTIPRHQLALDPEPGIQRMVQTPSRYASASPEYRTDMADIAMRDRVYSRSELMSRYERDVPADPAIARIEAVEVTRLGKTERDAAGSQVQLVDATELAASQPLAPVGEKPVEIASNTATQVSVTVHSGNRGTAVARVY